MLAHGTGGFQWQAVIVSLVLGGLWMHDSVVCSPLISFAEEELVYNALLHANSRFKENFSSYDFVSSNIALEALECGSTAYPVEEDCLGIVNSSVGEAVLDNCLQHEKSRLKKILLGYDFVGPNFQPGAQEGGTIAHSVKEDHQGIFVSSIEASFGQFDQSYLFDQKHPFDPFCNTTDCGLLPVSLAAAPPGCCLYRLLGLVV